MLAREVRQLILRYPEKAIDIPDALHILLDNGLPPDVSSQLKVCNRFACIDQA